MAKALVLGNSHVASVKVAYDQNRTRFGDIVFFAATGRDLAFTKVEAGRIIGADTACLDMDILKQFSPRLWKNTSPCTWPKAGRSGPSRSSSWRRAGQGRDRPQRHRRHLLSLRGLALRLHPRRRRRRAHLDRAAPRHAEPGAGPALLLPKPDPRLARPAAGPAPLFGGHADDAPSRRQGGRRGAGLDPPEAGGDAASWCGTISSTTSSCRTRRCWSPISSSPARSSSNAAASMRSTSSGRSSKPSRPTPTTSTLPTARTCSHLRCAANAGRPQLAARPASQVRRRARKYSLALRDAVPQRPQYCGEIL